MRLRLASLACRLAAHRVSTGWLVGWANGWWYAELRRARIAARRRRSVRPPA